MAIANYLKLHQPRLKVLYATCEQFLNQMVESLSKSKLTPQAFRNKFRNVDVLLIDDVQFISGKQSFQTEFFHTFNELFERHKQIVMTADRKPADMATLEERLRGRFGAGIMVSISPPDRDTRMSIIRAKAERLQRRLSV
jgi:chromosomal replication initiator protein